MELPDIAAMEIAPERMESVDAIGFAIAADLYASLVSRELTLQELGFVLGFAGKMLLSLAVESGSAQASGEEEMRLISAICDGYSSDVEISVEEVEDGFLDGGVDIPGMREILH